MATAQITPDQDAILAEIFIAAPPARVFEAISDVNQRAQWWGMKGNFHVNSSASDLRPGGKWSHEGVGPAGQPFHMEGEYLEVEPPRLLVHTRQADFVGNSTPLSAGNSKLRTSADFMPAARIASAPVLWCA